MKKNYTAKVFVECGGSVVSRLDSNVVNHDYILSYIDREDKIKYLSFTMDERLESGHPCSSPLNFGQINDCNLEGCIITKSSILHGLVMYFDRFDISNLIERIEKDIVTSYRRQDRKSKKKRRNRGRQYLNSFRWD